uniref:hypothetical protein n=1 Tax=Alistipes sp. TaxID=1872444 RepID=UPI0040572423
MEELDKRSELELNEEEMFSSQVVQGEADLLYLDSYLREFFRSRGELRSSDERGV